MAKQTVDDLLSKARDKLYDENIITLLGKTGAGKTVASALLKHALFNRFIPLHGGRFEAIVAKGGAEVDDVLAEMKKGRFPSGTRHVNAPLVELELHKMSGVGAGKTTLILQDSSGETYTDLLHDEFADPKERLERILTYNNENGDVGPLAPYIFSKVYLLAIECTGDKSEWDTKHSSGTIRALHEIHAEAKLTHNKKVSTHIAILFTKADVLDEDDQNKHPSELLDHMPELKSALTLSHRGQRECFKLSIDVEPESTYDRDQRVVRSRQLATDHFLSEQNDYERRLTKSIEESKARARKEKSSQYGERALEQYVKEAASKAEQQFRASDPAPRLTFNEDEEKEFKYKIKKGLPYSDDEYVRLITWIIDRLYD